VFWKVLIDRAGSVAGYGFKEIMLVWAFSSSAFGLGHVVFGNCRALGGLIVNGGLDVYLLQPKNELIHLLISRTEVSAWGDFIYGLALMVAVTGFDPTRWAIFLLFVVTGSLVFSASFILADCLGFFARSSSGFSRLYTELMLSASLYPDTLYGAGLRWVFYSLLPAGYIVFLPLRAFRLLDWRAGLIAFAASAAYIALAFLAFKRGLRKYESGNLISTRM
jgi:ABC-2 type transport system permease protein